jgi:hypothetical protein
MWADANNLMVDYSNPPDYFRGATGKGKKPPYA